MPLFEGRRARASRIIHRVGRALLEELNQVVADPNDRIYHTAWLGSGTLVAVAAAAEFESLRKPWARGDDFKALRLIKVFTLPMVSRWYRMHDESVEASDDVRQLARETSGSNMLALFGQPLDRELIDFMNMDCQYNYEKDWYFNEGKQTGGAITYECCLMISQALIACGGSGYIDWGHLEFLVTDAKETLYEPGFPHDHVVADLLLWASTMNLGVGKMLSFQKDVKERLQALRPSEYRSNREL